MTLQQVFQRYLLPGFVFQSVIVGGGYGTGREIAEYFVGHGAIGGLLGMLIAALAWGLVLALAFEFARKTKSYNYRAFFRALLGRFWRLFEVIYILIAVLVLAVLGSASGEILADAFGVPQLIGILLLLISVGILTYLGSQAVARLLTYWSFVLYAAYGVFLVWILVSFGDDIGVTITNGEVIGDWHLDGLRYAAYNLNALAAVLFILPVLTTRREAMVSGFVAGLIGILPAIFVFVAMLAQYPEIGAEAVPVTSLLVSLNALWFLIIFQIVLFGTFIETGAGIIHAVNERVADSLAEQKRPFPRRMRFAIAIGLLGAAVFLADRVGIISLIAQGYGLLSYAFIAIVIIPLMTVGLVKIFNHSNQATSLLSKEP